MKRLRSILLLLTSTFAASTGLGADAPAATNVVSIFADIREFKAKMGEATATVREFGAEATTMSERLKSAGTKMANVVALGVGGAIVYGVREAYKYNEALDAIANQSNASCCT